MLTVVAAQPKRGRQEPYQTFSFLAAPRTHRTGAFRTATLFSKLLSLTTTGHQSINQPTNLSHPSVDIVVTLSQAHTKSSSCKEKPTTAA